MDDGAVVDKHRPWPSVDEHERFDTAAGSTTSLSGGPTTSTPDLAIGSLRLCETTPSRVLSIRVRVHQVPQIIDHGAAHVVAGQRGPALVKPSFNGVRTVTNKAARAAGRHTRFDCPPDPTWAPTSRWSHRLPATSGHWPAPGRRLAKSRQSLTKAAGIGRGTSRPIRGEPPRRSRRRRMRVGASSNVAAPHHSDHAGRVSVNGSSRCTAVSSNTHRRIARGLRTSSPFASRKDVLSRAKDDEGSFHRHALGQVPRLINVAAAQQGNVVRQKLQRDGHDDGCK